MNKIAFACGAYLKFCYAHCADDGMVRGQSMRAAIMIQIKRVVIRESRSLRKIYNDDGSMPRRRGIKLRKLRCHHATTSSFEVGHATALSGPLFADPPHLSMSYQSVIALALILFCSRSMHNDCVLMRVFSSAFLGTHVSLHRGHAKINVIF